MTDQKKTFIGYSDWIDYTEDMSDAQIANLFKCILLHANAGDPSPLPEIKFVRSKIKKRMDEDKENREKVSNARRDAANERRSKKQQNNANASKCMQMHANASKSIQMHANAPKNMQMHYDNENENDNKNVNVNDSNINQLRGFTEQSSEAQEDLTKKRIELGQMAKERRGRKPIESKHDLAVVEDTHPPTPLPKKQYGKPEINDLIARLQAKAEELGVIYDNTKERQFGRHILAAKAFGEFCAKYGQDRVDMACYVMEASQVYSFFKGAAAGPMKIYQRYTDIANDAIKKSKKSQAFVSI